MGPLHEEIEVVGEGECVRSFRVHSYLAFYQEDEAGILILRVLHGRRDYRSLF
jgi:plasmid stabilization system protein ParE